MRSFKNTKSLCRIETVIPVPIPQAFRKVRKMEDIRTYMNDGRHGVRRISRTVKHIRFTDLGTENAMRRNSHWPNKCPNETLLAASSIPPLCCKAVVTITSPYASCLLANPHISCITFLSSMLTLQHRFRLRLTRPNPVQGALPEKFWCPFDRERSRNSGARSNHIKGRSATTSVPHGLVHFLAQWHLLPPTGAS